MAAHARGTESGGGGTTVLAGNQRLLFDFLVLDPSFKDIDSFEKYNKLTMSSDFLLNHENKIFGAAYDESAPQSQNKNNNLNSPRDFFTSDPFQLATSILNSWRDNNMLNFSTDTILSGLYHPVNWSITDIIALENFMSFEKFPHLKVSSPKFAAYYQSNLTDPKNKHIIQISANIWNELGLLSQAGLIIHEGSRHPQISYGRAPSYFFTDSILQKTTAIIMLCEPRPTLSMYINHLHNNKESQVEQLSNFGSFDDVVRKYCKRKKYVSSNL